MRVCFSVLEGKERRYHAVPEQLVPLLAAERLAFALVLALECVDPHFGVAGVLVVQLREVVAVVEAQVY